jgi:ATP-dependent RNA helicase RhlE
VLLHQFPESTLIFTRTKRRADKITAALEKAKLSVETLHADRSQGQRRHALEGFRQGKYRVLVATDIAARGLDVADIGHVINYDLPHVAEDYVHRIGRTARASASGRASSFAAPEDADLLRAIERVTSAPVPRAPVPRGHAVFKATVRELEARQRDPGPPQPGHGVSTRTEDKPLGRHARTHKKKG